MGRGGEVEGWGGSALFLQLHKDTHTSSTKLGVVLG